MSNFYSLHKINSSLNLLQARYVTNIFNGHCFSIYNIMFT